MWGATTVPAAAGVTVAISIHAPRVGRDLREKAEARFCGISIHAPRVGRDCTPSLKTLPIIRFQSTRPVWGATALAGEIDEYSQFQSTRPVWGATGSRRCSQSWLLYFNPRAPCGARRDGRRHIFHPVRISIHAPRVGRDCDRDDVSAAGKIFQSTRPVWGATSNPRASAFFIAISIHAPRVGRDYVVSAGRRQTGDFNPRAPCGARLWLRLRLWEQHLFQSTRPVWGATTRLMRISCRTFNFNPRAPCGARLRQGRARSTLRQFQSTRPVWGATVIPADRAQNPINFNPRAPCGARLTAGTTDALCAKFQSTRPVWGATESKR